MKTILLSKSIKVLAWTVIIPVACLVFLLLREGVRHVDRLQCYSQLASELGVSPTSAALRRALYSELLLKIRKGSTYHQTMLILEKEQPYELVWRRSDLNNGYKEYILLDHCSFSVNDFGFLFIFSKEDTLVQILNYVDD